MEEANASKEVFSVKLNWTTLQGGVIIVTVTSGLNNIFASNELSESK